MKYLGFFILVVGALFVYLSKIITKKLKKSDEVEEADNLKCKLLGLVIAVVGVILVFVS